MNIHLSRKCRAKLAPLLDLRDYGPMPDEVVRAMRRRIMLVFFTKIRAIKHVKKGYPDNQFRVRTPERDMCMTELIEQYRAYLKGKEARSRFKSEEDNPYKQILGEMTLRGINLQACWKVGYDGKSF